MRAWLYPALMALLLAGCADSAPAAEAEVPEPTIEEAAPEVDPVAAGMVPPAWQVGQWWAYDTLSGRTTRIVTDETADAWIVASDNIAAAFYDARDPISNMGPQRKSDLAGSQGAASVQFFAWPLVDGASWTTTWDGREISITATANNGTWFFEGQNGGNVYVDYTYDPSVAWMRQINFYGDDASLQYSMTLNSWGDAYDGNVVDLSYEIWIQENLTNAQNGGDTPGAPPESTDLWLDLDMTCTSPGAMSFVIGTGENTIGAISPQNASHGAAWHDACPGTNVTEEHIGYAPYPEDWGYHAAIASDGGRVAFTVYARTYEFVPWVGGQPA